MSPVQMGKREWSLNLPCFLTVLRGPLSVFIPALAMSKPWNQSLSLSLFFFFFGSAESQDIIWVSEKAELQEESCFGKQRGRRTHSDLLSCEPLPWLPIGVCLRLTQHGAKQEDKSTFHQNSDWGVFYSQTMNKHSINQGDFKDLL